MELIGTRALNILERSLDAATLSQKVIVNNIANASTPNFKRSEVKFEQYLLKELNAQSGKSIVGRRTDSRHIHIGRNATSNPATAQVVTDNSTKFNHNNNNVDIDYEMALLAWNQLKYNLLIERTNGFFSSMRTAIDNR